MDYDTWKKWLVSYTGKAFIHGTKIINVIKLIQSNDKVKMLYLVVDDDSDLSSIEL